MRDYLCESGFRVNAKNYQFANLFVGAEFGSTSRP